MKKIGKPIFFRIDAEHRSKNGHGVPVAVDILTIPFRL
jgi:hypothetical protein